MTTSASFELLLGLFASSPDGLWVTDADGRTVHANERMAEILGTTVEELVGADTRDFAADERGRTDFDGHLSELRSGHPGRENEDALIRRRDGTTTWTLVSWRPIPGPEGAPIGYLHRMTERSERRELFETLRERERQLETAQRIAHVGSWSWDVTTDAIVWSDELYRIYGRDPRDVTTGYADFIDALHPDDRDDVTAVILTAMRRQVDFEWESRVLLDDDGVRWVRGRGVVERGPDGTVTCLSGTAQDITDLHLADDVALQASQRLHLLQRIAEAANQSTTMADALVRAARVLESSDWRPVCVWVRPVPGQPLAALELPEPAAPDLPPPDVALAEAGWASRELDVAPIPERPGHSLVTLPVPLGHGVACVIQLHAAVTEPDVYAWSLLRQIGDQLGRVAERERSALQLAEARDAAMTVSQHKSDFLAMMSHEIRTPMNGVIGLNDLLLRTALDNQQRRLAEELRGAGLTLLGLINDILDLSKIESGRLELERTTFDLRVVMDETASILAGRAQEKGLELVVACAPEVPRTVVGDPVRLRQVLTNLGSNAVKFTDSGEVVIEATLFEPERFDKSSDRADADADTSETALDTVTVRVEVRDTGIGIDLDRVDDIFDVFTQADLSTTRQHGGTGLGLAICRQLVDAMGGHLDVVSSPGAGSIFSFTGRFGRLHDDVSQRYSAHATSTNRQVLVVDDNAAAGRHLAGLLTQWSLVPQVVTSMAAVLEIAAVGDLSKFGLALIDRDLADGDGLELGRRLRAAAPTLDLVLVTSDPMINPTEISAAGFRTWIAKPVRTAALHEALADRDGPRAPASHAEDQALNAQVLDLYVLVVEDNPVNQLVATGMLEHLGCQVDTAANGVDAVRALDPGHSYDLVLMDCRMPRMDGFAATRAIRARESDGQRVPIVAVTASALAGERERCLDAGMDDFLSKPVDRAQLIRTLHRWSDGLPPTDAPPVRPTPAEAITPVLDQERVEMLAELIKDGINFFERARMSFLARIDGMLAELRIAVSDGDAARADAAAHQLKGSALNLGLALVGQAAAAIEEVAREGTLEGVEPLLVRLTVAVREGVAVLARTVIGGTPEVSTE